MVDKKILEELRKQGFEIYKKKPKEKWTTIGIPVFVKDALIQYGNKRESWPDLLLRLIKEVEESKQIKERYGLK